MENKISYKHYVNVLSRLSEYRTELMGVAVIFIYLFHSGDIGMSQYYNVFFAHGYLGVDVFFFLSSIGLCFSLSKDSRTFEFYKRRIARIWPTWIFVLISMHLLGILSLHFKPDTNYAFPHSIAQYFTWYTGLGFYVCQLLDLDTPDEWYYEWYVPAAFFFYLLTPWLYRQKSILLVFLFSVCLIAFWGGHNSSLRVYFWLFYQRIPVFILGIIFYRIMVNNEISDSFCNRLMFILSGISAVLLFFYNTGSEVPISYIFLFSVPLVLVVSTYVIEWLHVGKILSFYGTISLELYLIHLHNHPLYVVRLFVPDKLLAILINFLVLTIAAYILHLFVNKSLFLLKSFVNSR